MKKYTLSEDFEDEVIPVAIPNEAELAAPVIEPEVKNNALKTLLNNSIKREFEYLDSLNSDIATIKQEAPERQDIISILEEVALEKNIHVGMITKALSLLDDEAQNLMNAGVEKAEQIISEPATQDLDKE